MHVKLPTGEEGILTARAKKPLFGRGIGELVWLSLPADLDNCFPDMPAASECAVPDLEARQTTPTRHTTMHKRAIEIATTPKVAPTRPIANTAPWVETILAEGPDVMFEVLDLDRSDDCLEVISAHFFGQKLSVHSIKAIPEAPFIEISAMKTLDTIGRPYGLCLATMTPTLGRPKEKEGASIQADYSSCDNSEPTHLLVSTHECSYDIPSAYNMALSALGGIYPSIITGAAFAFRNGQQSVRPGLEDADIDVRGGSLFSYEIPRLISRPNATDGTTAIIQKSLSSRTDRTDASRKDSAHVSEDTHSTRRSFQKGLDDKLNNIFVQETATVDNSISSVDVATALQPPRLSTDVERYTFLFLTKSSSNHQHWLIFHFVSSMRSISPSQKYQLVPPNLNILLSSLSSTSLNWRRQTLFRGFKVCGWGGIFSPGAPGFPYVFRMPNKPQVSLQVFDTTARYNVSPTRPKPIFSDILHLCVGTSTYSSSR